MRNRIGPGLATAVGLQAWIIMAGNAGLAPLTGVTLPFISYGGSSLMTMLIALGVAHSVMIRHKKIEI